MRQFDQSPRCVVLHADDFGMNPAATNGILTAFREGLLTSTSLLANAPDADAARQQWPSLISDHHADRLKSTPVRREIQDSPAPFDLGIHLNLTQGRPLTEHYPAELLDDNGHFPGIGRLFFRLRQISSSRLSAVEMELWSQIEWMVDNGLKPTHVNGHQYLELIPQIAAMIPKLLKRYSIPVVRVARESGLLRSVLFQGRLKDWGLGLIKRSYANRFEHRMQQAGIAFADRYFGTCHAGQIDLQTVERFLQSTGSSPNIEIGLHPGIETNLCSVLPSDPWFDPLRDVRPNELKMLCSDRLCKLLQGSSWRLGRLSELARVR